MSGGGSWRRRLARRLLDVSAWLLPASRSAWGAAMHAEVHHIDDDKEALAWASSSVRAGLSERFCALQLHPVWSARSAGLLWIVIFIVSSAFNFSLALAVRLNWEPVAFAMGGWLRGFDYGRFELLARSMPVALFVLLGSVVAAFCLSLYLSLRLRHSAFFTFCCALGMSLAAWLYQLGIPAYVQAISAPHRWRSGMCFVLTAGVLSALRLGSRARPPCVGRST